jgi:hypothetical protein
MVKKIVISYNVHEYLMFRRFIHDYFQFSTIDNICTDVIFSLFGVGIWVEEN